VLLFLGFGCFLLIFLSEDGREIFPEIVLQLVGGYIPRGEDAIIVSSLLMLPVVALATPFLLRWLERSRLLSNFLRVWAGILAACYLCFLIMYGDEAPEILVPLALSTTLTFIGLCLVKRRMPPDPLLH
jgi:hypothetical protein